MSVVEIYCKRDIKLTFLFKQGRYHAFVGIGEYTGDIFVLRRLLLFASLQEVRINSV